MARWMGVSDSYLNAIFPDLANFGSSCDAGMRDVFCSPSKAVRRSQGYVTAVMQRQSDARLSNTYTAPVPPSFMRAEQNASTFLLRWSH